MSYVDQVYYVTTFGGSVIPPESQDQALEFASDLVDAATQNRIPDWGFERLTAFQQGKIKRACCLIAEDVYSSGVLSGSAVVVSGFSLGDFSIQAQPNMPSIGGVPVREAALQLLRSSGLAYAGVV